MNSKIKILIGILIAGILLIGGWGIWKSQHIPTQPSKSIIQSELKISVDGKLETITDIYLPIDKIEAEKIVKKFCEPENPNYDYDYNAIKKVNDEWRIPIYNLNCPCYAVVNIESGETNCMKEIPFEIQQVTITTDKTEYEQGEIVSIRVKNNLDKSIWYYEWSEFGCIGGFSIGKRKEGYKEFYPLATEKCLRPIVKLEPKSERVYKLNLSLSTPARKHWEEYNVELLGTFKLKFNYFLNETSARQHYINEAITIYSNEFTIRKRDKEETLKWKTYTNKEYGFEIKHPSYISPATTPNDWADGMVDPKGNGKLIVNFIACQFSEIPPKEPYHSFTGEIRIRVNPTIVDAKDCLNLPFEFPNMKKENVNINGIEFKKFSKIEDAAMGQRLKMEVYRTLYNNACFSIEKVEHGYLFDELENSSSPHFDLEFTKKFNSCRKTLDQMISTFRFYSETKGKIDIFLKEKYSIIDKLSLIDEKYVKEYRIGTAKFKIFPKLKNQFGYFEAYNKGKKIYKSEPIYRIHELLAFEYKNNKYIILTEYCGGAHGGYNEYVFILDKNNELKLIKVFYLGNSPISEKNLLFKNGGLYLYYLDGRFNYFYSCLADSISFKQYFLIKNDNLIRSNGDFKKEYLKEASDYEKRLEELYQKLSSMSKEAQKKVSFEVWFRLLLGKTVNYLLAREEKKAWEDFDETFDKFSLISASPPKEKNEIKREIIEKMKDILY